MRIDSYQHFWKYDHERDGWIMHEMHVLKRDYLPADLEPELDARGVHASVAVQADQSESETDFLLQLAEQHPFIAGIIGWTENLLNHANFNNPSRRLRVRQPSRS
jgi:L-fuconolactonase